MGMTQTTQTIKNRDNKGKFVKGNKAALKSGCNSWIVKGSFPPLRGVKKLKRELADLKIRLEKSVPELDVRASLLINSVVKAHGFCLLFEEHCKKIGLFTFKEKELDFCPGFRVYQTFQNQIRHSIKALNSSHGQDKILTISEILEKESEEKNGDQNSRTA